MTDQEKIDKAIELALKYGMTDGSHHKNWVIDQIVRILTDCPEVKQTATDYRGTTYEYTTFGESERYKLLIEENCDGVDGPNTYEWNTGIAP